MRSAAIALLGVLLVAPPLGCNDSPTEPVTSSPTGTIGLTIEVSPMSGDTGVLSLSTGVCGCTSSSVSVLVNGISIGTLPCAAAQDFALPRTVTGTAGFEIRVTDNLGTSGSRSVEVTGNPSGALSVTVRATCR